MAWPTVGDGRDRALGRRRARRRARRCTPRSRARSRAYEPVTMVAAPADAEQRREQCCGAGVEVVALPIDDSWMRDTGPIVVVAADGDRHALHFRFNAWGEKWSPWDADAAVGARDRRAARPARCARCRWCSRADRSRSTAPGSLVTTERCLLNPNRNPDDDRRRDRGDAASAPRRRAHRVAGRRDRRGRRHRRSRRQRRRVHRARARRCSRAATTRRIRTTRSRPTTARRLDAGRHRGGRGPACCRTREFASGRSIPVPYVNLYALQRRGARAGERRTPPTPTMLAIIGAQYPGREVVAVPGAVLAHGGGGVHCITQQVPAGQADRDACSPRTTCCRRRRACTRRPARRSASALVQERWHPDPDEHRDALARGVRAAAGEGARLVCLQELTLSPYFAITPDGPGAAGVEPEPLPGGPTLHVRGRARGRDRRVRARVALRARRRPRRRARLQHRDRRRARRRARRPDAARCTCPSPPATTRTATSGPATPASPWSISPTRASASRRAGTSGSPRSRASYALRGADVIVYPTAIGSEPDHPDFDTEPLWEQVIRANGIANGTFMVVPNRIGTEGPVTFYGSSFISDPYGRVLVQAPRDRAGGARRRPRPRPAPRLARRCSRSSRPAGPTPTACSPSRTARGRADDDDQRAHRLHGVRRHRAPRAAARSRDAAARRATCSSTCAATARSDGTSWSTKTTSSRDD